MSASVYLLSDAAIAGVLDIGADLVPADRIAYLEIVEAEVHLALRDARERRHNIEDDDDC